MTHEEQGCPIHVITLVEAETTRIWLGRMLMAPDIVVDAHADEACHFMWLIQQYLPHVAILFQTLHDDAGAGMKLTREIREYSVHTRCIIISDRTESQIDNRLEAARAGAARFLATKELARPDTLLSAVRSVARITLIVPASAPGLPAPAPDTAETALSRPLNPLTPRQQEVLYWMGQENDQQKVADILSITRATVRKMLELTYDRLGPDLPQRRHYLAVELARTRGWIEPPNTRVDPRNHGASSTPKRTPGGEGAITPQLPSELADDTAVSL